MVLLGDDAAAGQHLRMGQAPLDILPVQPRIKLDGRIEVVDQAVRLFAEPSAP